MPPLAAADIDTILDTTRHWLEHAVIGLNLCPFAKAVHVKRQIRYVVSAAASEEELLTDLERELRHLHAASPHEIDTTLLIHPHVLEDFHDYNAFLDIADAVVEDLALDGILQVASFHPQYQFAGTGPDDITNYTNRSPYPILHLLREASIDRAVDAFPQASSIYEQNMKTLRKLGTAGWERLMRKDKGDQA